MVVVKECLFLQRLPPASLIIRSALTLVLKSFKRMTPNSVQGVNYCYNCKFLPMPYMILKLASEVPAAKIGKNRIYWSLMLMVRLLICAM